MIDLTFLLGQGKQQKDILPMATLSISEEEAGMPKNPDLELAQKRFLLTLNAEIVSPAEKQTIKEELLAVIKKDSMALSSMFSLYKLDVSGADALHLRADMLPFYNSLCEQFKWKPDAALVGTMKAENEKKVQELSDTITDAEQNLGESEVREGYLARADFYCKIGDKEKAIQAFRETTEKTVGLGQKLDILFTLIRMGFFWNDDDLVTRNIEKAKRCLFSLLFTDDVRAHADVLLHPHRDHQYTSSMIEQGGDWDRRNRLKVYEALHNASIRKFREAADLFLEGLATFTSYELCTYNHFIFYAILMSAVSIDRVNLQKKVKSTALLNILNHLMY